MGKMKWPCVVATLVVACSLASAKAPPRPGPKAPAKTVRVAAVQLVSKLGAVAENCKRLAEKVREAAGKGAKIIVLPETSITGYTSWDLAAVWQLPGWRLSRGVKGVHPGKYAQPIPGPATKAFCKLAAELGIYLTVPLLEVDPKSGRYFNSLVLAGPKGEMLLHYRKLNPWPWAERGWATQGDRGHQYVDTEYGRLALLICYDVNFEPQKLKKAKIDTLLYSIAWVDDKDSSWFDKNLPAIARKNDMNIIGANWTVGGKVDWHGHGDSRIISRAGKILAKPKDKVGETILYAELAVPAAPAKAPPVAPARSARRR